ncbi:MAG: DUF3795 domain-containing protein [Methanomassiliicoccaceae archaeon]|jgi:hypothetical protein|nr:DUF3795 domain-containing protein [Methanomassiliicoccaceae archaeon]
MMRYLDMDRRYACYCGLCCENCAIKVKVFTAAKILHDEMRNVRFDEVVKMIPGGDGFWTFLKDIAENGATASCRGGCGDPGCKVRICAVEKGIEMCAFCDEYPCTVFKEFSADHPIIVRDNALLREKGWDAWLKLQDERRAKGFTYGMEE